MADYKAASFTMRDAARNAGRHNSWRPYASSTKLRYSRINFVSGGSMVLDESRITSPIVQTSKPEQPPAADPENPKPVAEETAPVAENVEPIAESTESAAETKEAISQSTELAPEKTEPVAQESNTPNTEGELFFIDTQGDETVVTNIGSPPVIPQRSRSMSDSSEDEVVFTGRRFYQRSNLSVPVVTTVIEDDVSFAAGKDITRTSTVKPPDRAASPRKSGVEELKGPPGEERRPQIPMDSAIFDDDEAAILADYIANMDNSDDSASEDDSMQVDGLNLSADQESGREDTTSPPDESQWRIGHIFSRRKKHATVEYLVTREGESPELARWVRRESLTMAGAKAKVEAFEQEFAADTRSASSALAIDDDLSLDSPLDELSDDSEESQTVDDLLQRLQQYQSSRKRDKKGRRFRNTFPSATAFADALEDDPYMAFDIMDFDRPSLKKKKKGRRQALNFELSDSELEMQLQQAWENDRMKKKARKQEREMLRAQGLLGRKSKEAKDAAGMSADEIKSEVRKFLLSSAESLNLPPMDKAYRKLVHDLAHALNLKSHSKGKANKRHPVLYKTAATRVFTEENIYQVDAIFSRRRYNNYGDSGAGKAGKGQGKRGPRGRGRAAVSYADGDIVGASAPEIGADNKGRAMLEKMGWSSGTALGAAHNPGILQPVTHVVKNSRAGLG